MLLSLHIKNLALIDTLQLEFDSGFNVLTGETGAGKSVITGAVGLLMGSRADKSMIRQGADRCELSAIFRFPAVRCGELSALLIESGIEVESDSEMLELHLRRILTASGNRNFVNDSPVTAQLLAKIGELMIDIHAANEHYSLSNNAVQLQLLDRFGGLEAEQSACAEAFRQLRSVAAERTALLADLPSAAEAETLRITVEEIAQADFHAGEEQEVVSQYAVAANSSELMALAAELVSAVSEGEDSLSDRLSAARHQFDRLAHLDPDGASSFRETCAELLERTLELSRDLERYARKIEVDEERLNQLNDRLSLIQRMKRRYGPTLEAVLETLASAEKRLETFVQASDRLTSLEAAEKQAREVLETAASDLTQKRKAAAQSLSIQVSAVLNTLGFAKARFETEFFAVEPGANGADKIEFLFSANSGEVPGLLRSFASSGEMSRVMLAIKAVLARADAVPVLLFDEIDVNIGGETAYVVGTELRKLADTHQILCISHLAQVAVQADNHIRVSKSAAGDRTLTRAEALDANGRISEIGRMLGGGSAALKHAEELVNQYSLSLK